MLTAIAVTFFTTTCLDIYRQYRNQDKLVEAADLIERSFIGTADREAMTDAAISAMVDSLGDRWSYYLTAESLARYRNYEHNRYDGLGVVVQASEDGGLTVYSVYRDSPAGEAGLQPGSRIVGVNGRDIRNSTLQEAMDLVSSAIGEGEVELALLLPDGGEVSVTLVPGAVHTDPVSRELLPDGIGLVAIANFEDRSGEQAIAAVEDMAAQGAKGIIFDLRGNPGGQLRQLLLILDRLLPEGPLFISRDVDGKEETDYSDAECLELPMAVLVNGDTYSAAEFFAAALQEYGWATVVGEKTTGKGYAQVTLMLSDGSALHLSTVEYFTPQGNSLAGTGLTPDLAVELDPELLQSLYDDLLDAALDTQLEAARSCLLEKLGLT